MNMGKVKSTLIKRSAEKLSDTNLPFSEEFHHNKRMLGSTLPSKKLRNRIAGYIVRVKYEERKKAEMLKENQNVSVSSSTSS